MRMITYVTMHNDGNQGPPDENGHGYTTEDVQMHSYMAMLEVQNLSLLL